MAKPIQGNQSYLETLFDVASHTLVGAGAGALASKAFYPLQMKEGAIFGAALNTFAAGVQQLVKLAGFEESFASKTIVSAATLGAAFFALSQPSAATLLGRVGLDFAKDAIMKSCAASFLAELVLGVVKAYVTSAPTAESKVAAFTAEEVKEIYAKWTEKTTKKGEEEPEIPAELHEAFFARFEKDGLYIETAKGLKNSKDVVDARPDVIVFIFKAAPEGMALNDAGQKALEKRIGELKLAEKPAKKEDVDSLDPAVVRYAFEHYTVYTAGMDKDVKVALDAKIIELHAKKPEKEEEAGKMTPAQLTFVYANFASYTDKMDAKIVEALEKAILAAGVIKATKPADKDAPAKLGKLELQALHAQHEAIFGKAPKLTDADVITALNVEYKKAGLAEQVVPKKPDPKTPEKSTTDKVIGFGKSILGSVVNHPIQYGLAALGYGVVYGAETYFGVDVPYIPGI
ncbi:MAG: hypothetical protein KDK59_02040 [Simkania sp.]|nr:hypothetical protein [Simkania sp.]